MSQPEDIFDRALLALVARVSGRAVAVIALILYPGLGLIVPVLSGMSTSWLVSVNVMGVTFAALVSLGWLVVQLEAKDRRHLLEWTSDLRLLTGQEFEWLVGEVFRREGWKVTETGRQDGPDGNVDLRLTRGNDRRLVQCKRWISWQVGVDEIRAFGGTLMRENMTGSQGIFVTYSDFTEAAREEARKTGVVLLDRHELHNRVEGVRRIEPCPICERPMMKELGLDVKEVLRRGEGTASARQQALQESLAKTGRLYADLHIPHTAGALEIVADLGSHQIVLSTQLDAPKEGTSRGRVGWLLRQLKTAPPDLAIEARLAYTSATLTGQLGALREDHAPLIPDKSREIRGFRLSLTRDMGLNRSAGRNSFIDSVVGTTKLYYREILQNLAAWKPRAAMLRPEPGPIEEAETEVPAAIQDALANASAEVDVDDV